MNTEKVRTGRPIDLTAQLLGQQVGNIDGHGVPPWYH